jgi:hypothetical protein
VYRKEKKEAGTSIKGETTLLVFTISSPGEKFFRNKKKTTTHIEWSINVAAVPLEEVSGI